MAALIAATAFAAGAAGRPPAAAAAAAAAAATVSVSDGTLGISDGAGTNTLLTVASEAGLGGPLREDAEAVFGATRVLSFSHAFGPGLGFWSGLGPVAGAGCEPVAGDTGAKPGPHLACHPVRRIDLELGSGDDFGAVHAQAVSPPGACLDRPCTIPVPTRIDGGAGDDGLEFVSSPLAGAGTLAGGPGNDSLVFEGTGTVNGGPGDDFINLPGSSREPIHVVCGPGNDRVRAWHYGDASHYGDGRGSVKTQLDAASCPPILKWRGAVGIPPLGEALYGRPVGRIGRDGHLRLVLFKATEAVHGSVNLREPFGKIPNSDPNSGFPKFGTRWKPCGIRRIHFSVRAGQYLRVNLPIVGSVIRRAKPSRPGLLPCTFRVDAVDPQGERFSEEDATVWLRRQR